jgi:membrane-associated phospholipid phosphatase
MKGNRLNLFWKSRYGHIRFKLMDINCLAYMALIGFLLIFFHKAVKDWPLYVLIHAAWIVVVLEIIRPGEKYPERKISSALRTFYPIAILFYCWLELNSLSLMFFDSFWGTNILIRWDKLIFGVHPTVWMQRLYRPWLDETMNFIYAFYYTFFLLIPLYFYARKRNEEAWAIYSLATFTYLTNFVLFFLMPALSPNFIPMLQQLQVKEQTGYLFTALNRIIQASGGVAGAAFPSSHVAGALVWMLAGWRYSRKVGIISAPIVLTIGFSTVYMNLHHAVDPVSGYLWGAICFAIALKLIKKRGEDPRTVS